MQVKDCLKQNEELRVMLDKLRTEQASISIVNQEEHNKEGTSEISQAVVSLKVSHIIFSKCLISI